MSSPGSPYRAVCMLRRGFLMNEQWSRQNTFITACMYVNNAGKARTRNFWTGPGLEFPPPPPGYSFRAVGGVWRAFADRVVLPIGRHRYVIFSFIFTITTTGRSGWRFSPLPFFVSAPETRTRAKDSRTTDHRHTHARARVIIGPGPIAAPPPPSFASPRRRTPFR